MGKPAERAADTAGRELVFTRVFDAPRELVFAVWTDPKHLVNWYGPRGFTTVTHGMDVRVGGVWAFTMRGPDRDYPSKVVFHEVVRPERLVYQYVPVEGADDVYHTNEVTFADEGGKTRVTMRLVFDSPADLADVVVKNGATEGGNQTLDRLGELLAAQAPAGKVLVLTRSFAAPPELVFKAWTDPKHVAKWWGPAVFTNRIRSWDARPGGVIDLDMVGPDGSAFPMGGTFLEVEPDRKLVFTSTAFTGPDGESQLVNVNTVTFEAKDGRTEMTVRAVVVKASAAMAGPLSGMAAGWAGSLEKLAADLAPAEEFVLTREFAAPRELVFRAWTESERLAKWFGPAGMTVFVKANDPRPGGVMHYGMKTPTGQTMYGRWVYRAVVPPDRLAFVVSFADEHGNPVRAPFSDTWPVEVLSEITFIEWDGRTTVTMRGVPVNATAAEKAAFKAGHGNMDRGWAGTLDQLAAHLAAG
jgi:uncharacterized protein YndB with AHSA1/START domain